MKKIMLVVCVLFMGCASLDQYRDWMPIWEEHSSVTCFSGGSKIYSGDSYDSIYLDNNVWKLRIDPDRASKNYIYITGDCIITRTTK